MGSETSHLLVIGGGGREDALVRTLGRSLRLPNMGHLFAAPGNPGMAGYASCFPFPPDNIPALLNFAVGVDTKSRLLTVVGPEAPLAAGIVDEFRSHGLAIIGPNKAGAQIEADKVFALGLMLQHGIPTGRFRAFTPQSIREISDAEAYALTVCNWEGRVVIKANGLAAGKGVRVCNNQDEVREAMYIVDPLSRQLLWIS